MCSRFVSVRAHAYSILTRRTIIIANLSHQKWIQPRLVPFAFGYIGIEYAVQLPNALFEENRRRLMELFKMNSAPEANPVLLMRGKEELPIDCTGILYHMATPNRR